MSLIAHQLYSLYERNLSGFVHVMLPSQLIFETLPSLWINLSYQHENKH